MMLEELQKKLLSENLDAYIVTYGNRFIGQDILPKEHKLKYLCGFSGSAGTLVVAKDKAYLFVDGRYELQAQKEVDTDKITIVNLPPRLKNICELLRENKLEKIGYDAWCFTVDEIEREKRHYRDLDWQDKGDWIGIDNNESIEIFNRGVEFAGQSREDKCAVVANFLWEKKADYYLFTSADSVSWLLNIYANDLPCSPVVRAYALVALNGRVTLFGNVKTDEFEVKGWDELPNVLIQLQQAKVLYDGHFTPEKIRSIFTEDTVLEKAPDICQELKAEKNAIELQGMINCHKRDGVAIVKLLSWLENNWREQTEMDVVEKLHELRAEQDLFFSESFETIAGAAENGAIVHYQPTEKSNLELKENNLLLLDSGGQYLDGTTDVTRTIVLGEPSEDMKNDFTRVLKAHIALAQTRFPAGTSGMKLDILARSQMWQDGVDYKHGTGHGVACFGNVHEGPISISSRGTPYGFRANMVTSIEPGIYKENKYGIRIENLVYTRKVNGVGENLELLEFQYLTKVPIDKKLINKYLLTKGEQEWLNNYHRSVFDDLAAYVDEYEKKWLEEACSPI